MHAMTTNVVVPAVAAVEARDRFAAAYGILGAAIAQRAFPGCAFGVVAGGEVVLHDALGRFTYEADSPAVKPDTKYDVASLTKVVATTAAALFISRRSLAACDGNLRAWYDLNHGRKSMD